MTSPLPSLLLASVPPERTAVGLSVAVASKYGEVTADATGLADAAAGRALTPDTPMHACSMSKLLAAVAVVRLAELGHLRLDQDVATYLGEWSPAGDAAAAVTLERLLSHTSGIQDLPADGEPRIGAMPAIGDLLSGAARQGEPVRPTPGAVGTFSYSDAGYWVVERVLTAVTGTPYAAAVEALVWEPLGIGPASWAYDAPMPADAALGHEADGGVVEGGRASYAGLAAAGLWCTPSQLAALLADLGRSAVGAGGVLLGRDAALDLWRDRADGDGAGLGCFVFETAAGLTVQTHGWGKGFQGIARLLPERGTAMVAMMCSDPGVPQHASAVGAVAQRWTALEAGQD